MHSYLQVLRRTFIIAASVSALAACGSDAAVAPATPALFSTTVAFGASLDDTGNSCNLSPASCPPPPYATGRVSNGPLWLELVAQKVGATVAPSRTGGTNYAYSGARTGAIAGTTQSVPNMVQQVDAYLATASTANRAQALFIVNGATVGNDINDALVQGLTNPQAPTAIIASAIGNMTTIVGKLYAGGARNILLVNSTDIGKTPLVRASGVLASATATALSTQFNAAIAAQLPVVRRTVKALARYAALTWRVKKVVLVGLGVGAAVTAISYLTSHGLAATLSGVGAAVTTVAVQAGLWVRRTVRRLALA